MANFLKYILFALVLAACGAPAPVLKQPETPVKSTPEAPVVNEKWDTDYLARWIAGQNDDITTCYENVKIRIPELQGNIRVKLRLNSLGKVDSIVYLGNSTGSADLEKCMTRRFLQWSIRNGVGANPLWIEIPYEFEDWVGGPELSDSIRSTLEISDYCQSMKSELANCLMSSPEVDKDAVTPIGIAFSILPDGTVKDVRITENPVEDASLDLCLVNKIKTWKFRPLSATVIQPFSITFSFSF